MAGYNPPSVNVPRGTFAGGGGMPRVPIPGGKIAGGGGKKSRGPVNGGRPHGSRGGGRPHGGGKPHGGHPGGNRGHGGGNRGHGGGSRGSQNTSALYDPTQILSGQNLGNAAQSIADAQTVGPISELAKQIASNNQDSAGIQKQDFGYYMQLAKDAQDYVNGIPAAGLQQAAAMKGINDQTQSQLGQIGSEAQKGLGMYPGQGGQANQDLAALTAQQKGIATLNQQAANNLGATTFNNNLNAAKQQQASIGLGGQERISQVALAGQRANEPLNAKIAGLQASKGALKATAIGQLRQAERNYLVAQQGLGLKSQANNITELKNLTDAKLKIRGQDLTRRGQDVTLHGQALQHATDEERIAAEIRGQNITSKRDLLNYTLGSESLAEKTHNDQATQLYHQMELNLRAAQARGGKGPKPLSTFQNNTAWTKIGEVQNAITHLQQNGIKDKKGNVTNRHPTGAQIRQLLGQGYHPEFVEAAFELLGWGGLTGQTAKALHSMGIRGGSFRGKPVQIRHRVAPPLGSHGRPR